MSRKLTRRKVTRRKDTRRKDTRRKGTGRKITRRKVTRRKVTRRRSRSRGSKVRPYRLRNSSTMNKARSKSRMALKGGALPIADQIDEFLTNYQLHIVRHGYSCGNFKQGLTMRNPRAKLEGKMDVDPYLSEIGMELSKKNHLCREKEEDICIGLDGFCFASPLIRAQQTCVEMFDPNKLIIMPYCGEHQSSLDLDLDFFNDNFPDKKVWESDNEDTLKNNIKNALIVGSNSKNDVEIDVSLFFNAGGLRPYQIAIEPPDIIKMFVNLIKYVDDNEIPQSSNLYVVSHSHFMKDLGLYASNGSSKPLNNSIYKINEFDSNTKKFIDPVLIYSGSTTEDIDGVKASSSNKKQIRACNDLRLQRKNLVTV